MIRPSYLFDTNIFILLVADTHPALSARVRNCAAGSVGMSAIVGAELAVGFARAGERDYAAFDRLLKQFVLLPFDEAASRAYARIPFRRARFDRLIAAHALALDLTLVTNDERDFADVPGLRVENWARP